MCYVHIFSHFLFHLLSMKYLILIFNIMKSRCKQEMHTIFITNYSNVNIYSMSSLHLGYEKIQ